VSFVCDSLITASDGCVLVCGWQKVWHSRSSFVSEVSSNVQHIVATSPVVLRWLCDSPWTGCAWRITPLCM